jgi:hypothetical protein
MQPMQTGCGAILYLYAGGRVEIVASAEALTDALRSRRIDAGISEALMARQIAGTLGMHIARQRDPQAAPRS